MLAIDIGGGTQDILFWDPQQRLENCVKLVLPSPTRIAGKRIREAAARRRDVFLEGTVMGGGAVAEAVKEHLQAGLKVYARSQAALTFHDNLDYVRDMGVVITETRPPRTEAVVLGDLHLEALAQAVGRFGVDMPSRTAVAVQDHGFSPSQSNRLVRFRNLSLFLEQGGRLLDRVYHEPPPENSRMWAIKKLCPEALLMDTGTAAIMGALLDPTVAGWREQGVLVANLGNAHVLAAVIQGERVTALYEHHTACLNPGLLEDHLGRLVRGELTHQEVFEGMGHGVVYAPYFRPLASLPWAVTGPQRALASGTDCYLAAPFGDMMLSGCFGLVQGAIEKWGLPYRLQG